MNKILSVVLGGCLLLVTQAALAGHVTLSGTFDGNEDQIAPISGTCDEPEDMLGYQQLGPIEVSSTGVYDIADASFQSNFVSFAVDVVIRVYDGSFDPQQVSSNLVGTSVDIQDRFTLETNNSYVVVVQHWCSNRSGAFGIAISGEGDISGTGVVQSPDYWSGEFDQNDPQADFGLGESPYDVNGPIQFGKTGVYFYSDLSWLRRADLVLNVYDAPFNPQDIGANAVAVLDDGGSLTLEAGKDYYFVTYPFDVNDSSEWHFALFPPGDAAINMFFGGAWNDASMDYQGILLTVLPTYSYVFLAWYTYEEGLIATKQSTDGASSPTLESVGDSSQRWISAGGTYIEGASEVNLTFENSYGGAFNSSAPAAQQDKDYGTGRLILEDCNNVTIEYDLPTGPGQGSYAVSRVGGGDPFRVELCEELGLQPGVIE